MKNYLLLIVLFICSHIKAQTIYPSGVSGCIARWTFDAQEGGNLSTIQDWSGNNNHGNNNNITSTAGWKGEPFTAGKFNGSSSWSEVLHSNILNSPNEISMICLIKFSSFNSSLCTYNQILSKGYPHFIAGNYGLGVGDNPYDNDCYIFSPNYEQLQSQCGSGTFTTLPGNYIQLNKWYFLATTISNGNVINYQIIMDSLNKAPNMGQINNTNGSFNIGNNNQNISLGRHLNPQYPYWVEGDMDEVILFNRVLTPAELYTVYEYLYGYATEASSITKAEDKYQINVANSEMKIFCSEENYSYEIFNSFGQIIRKKVNCSNFENVDFTSYAKQIVFVKIVDKNNKVYYCSKLIQ